MHRSGCSWIVLTSPVIKTQVHVGRLLDFSYEYTSVRRVHSPRSNEKHITFLRMNHIENFFDSAVLASVIQLLSSHFTVESAENPCTRLRVQHIPHFCLAQRIISLGSNLIIRMDLDRKTFIDVQELYQERKLTAIIIIYILTHYPLKIGLHDLADRIAGQPAVRNHRILYAHVCKFPALSDTDITSQDSFIPLIITFCKMLSQLSHKSISTPWSSRRDRNELKRI